MEGAALFAAALAGLFWVVARPEWAAPYFVLLIYLRLSDALRGEFGLPSLVLPISTIFMRSDSASSFFQYASSCVNVATW